MRTFEGELSAVIGLPVLLALGVDYGLCWVTLWTARVGVCGVGIFTPLLVVDYTPELVVLLAVLLLLLLSDLLVFDPEFDFVLLWSSTAALECVTSTELEVLFVYEDVSVCVDEEEVLDSVWDFFSYCDEDEADAEAEADAVTDEDEFEAEFMDELVCVEASVNATELDVD